jgi:DNA replication protein DnaC
MMTEARGMAVKNDVDMFREFNRLSTMTEPERTAWWRERFAPTPCNGCAATDTFDVQHSDGYCPPCRVIFDAAEQVRRTVKQFDHWGAMYRESAADPEGAIADGRVKMPGLIALAKQHCETDKAVFIGAAGRGKSTLAAIMTRYRVDARRLYQPPMFIRARSLGGAGMHKRDEGIAEVAMDAWFAVIDDVGVEANVPSSALADVIDSRHERKLPTWFTTGMSAEEIAARYGAGIARRMFENAIIFDLGGR